MTTTNQTLAAAQDQPAKSTVFFSALALATLMVGAAAGGAGFMVYHEFSAPMDAPQAGHAPRTVQLHSPAAADAVPGLRTVAAEASDHSDYRFADNTILPPAAARRVIAAWVSNPILPSMPAPLAKPEPAAAAAEADGGPAAAHG